MTTTPEATPPVALQPATPHASDFETHGIDTVPRAERQYSPKHIFAVLYGSDLALSIIVVGALPIAFGLGWWQSVAAILIGGAVGGAVLAPMGLLAPHSGTNNAVSSGASFGVAGRFVGTTLGLFSALGFVAITIWTSGDALVSSIARITDTEVTGLARALGYAVIAAVILGICIRGIHLLLRIQARIMVPLMSLVMFVGLFAFGPSFDAGYSGGTLLLAGFWPTFTLSALVVASTVISYGPFIGDWARYIDSEKHAPSKAALATGLGGFVGVSIPCLWGAFVASAVLNLPNATGVFVPDMVGGSPTWYLPGLVLLGLVAGCAQGAVGLYGTGLDTSSLIPRLSRVRATLAIAVVAIGFVYLGNFVWEASAAVSAFLVLLVVVTTPWIVILSISYFYRRGFFLADDLQVFTRGQVGGRYWFDKGMNWRAVGAWMPASIIGILFAAAPPLLTGPWANAAGGIDLSFPAAGVVGGILYTTFLLIWPEPTYVMGPDGPRFGSSVEGTAQPIKAHRAEATPAS